MSGFKERLDYGLQSGDYRPLSDYIHGIRIPKEKIIAYGALSACAVSALPVAGAVEVWKRTEGLRDDLWAVARAVKEEIDERIEKRPRVSTLHASLSEMEVFQ